MAKLSLAKMNRRNVAIFTMLNDAAAVIDSLLNVIESNGIDLEDDELTDATGIMNKINEMVPVDLVEFASREAIVV